MKMNICFIDKPLPIAANEYVVLRDKLVSLLRREKSVKSIYQMGSIRNPGISDLDLICVFKDGSSCDLDLRSDINSKEKAILTHGVFGVEHSQFLQCVEYNLISNLTLLKGDEVIKLEKKMDPVIGKQVALEYLVKLLYTLDYQLKIKVVKLRAFLLLAKAVQFDLELLNISNEKLNELVDEVIDIRNSWFEVSYDRKVLTNLVFSFYDELKKLVKSQLEETSLYLPLNEADLPGPFKFESAIELQFSYRGLVLPNLFAINSKRYVALQYKLLFQTLHLPIELPLDDSIHSKRFELMRDQVKMNRENFPFFLPLTTSFPMFYSCV